MSLVILARVLYFPLQFVRQDFYESEMSVEVILRHFSAHTAYTLSRRSHTVRLGTSRLPFPPPYGSLIIIMILLLW